MIASISECVSNKWVFRFMAMAKTYASFSKDPSTKVGAIISKGNTQLGQGYNGFPSNIPDSPEYLDDREVKLAFIHHAEYNAVTRAMYSSISLTNATIYVTAPPCTACAKLINLSGITEIIYLPAGVDFEERYRRDIELMTKFCGLTGIKVHRLIEKE